MVWPLLAFTPTFNMAASSTPASKLQVGLLIGGVVLLVLLTLRQRSKSFVRDKRGESGRLKQDASQTVSEVEAVMAQLDHLSRQIQAKIDLKLATLQKLIRDADQRIDQLTSVQRDASSEPKLDIRLGPENPEELPVGQVGPHEAIYQLADAGYTPLQIAKELSRHTGEVELILSLRRAKQASSFPPSSIRKQAG